MTVLSVGGELANPNETNNVGVPASPPIDNKQDLRFNLMTLEPDPLNLAALLDAFPKEFVEISPQEQELSMVLYRLLARGEPVTHPQLAEATAMPVAEVDRWLAQWLGVYHDDAGRVTGFLGLALNETPHKLRLDGRELYAWCAWDTLFLPALMGKAVDVISHCAQTGEEIRLRVDPEGIVSLEPETTVLSFVTPDEEGIRKDVINSFCQSVLFFASPVAGASWVASHPNTFLMSVRDASALAQRFVQRKYPGLVARLD